MPSPVIIGTQKGVFGTSQRLTGVVLETTDFDYSADKVEYPNEYGDTQAVAYCNPKIKFSMKGLLVNGTAFTGTVASTLSLSSIPSHLPTGYSPGASIIETIKIGEEAKGFRSITIDGENMPSVTA